MSAQQMPDLAKQIAVAVLEHCYGVVAVDDQMVSQTTEVVRAAIAKATGPRFPMTYCSQCGSEQGPGDEGVSHCSDHRTKATGSAS